MQPVRWVGAPLPALRDALTLAGYDVISTPGPRPDLPVLVVTTSTRIPAAPQGARWLWIAVEGPLPDDRAREAVRNGAVDAVSWDASGAGRVLERLAELVIDDPEPPATDGVVAVSRASRRVLARAARVAATSMSVLLTGETGTGKEVLARLIHAWSPRAHQPFVPINCAAIPNELMEAELFGYARGAFSGAVQRYDGQLVAAEGGTVFLDEIDDTPLATQVKLLRVLEDRVVSRLGENTWHQVDFRVVAATNRDLRPLIEAGAFGADLYQRLAIARIHLSPLRERVDDLPVLASHFIERFRREQPHVPGARVTSIRDDALRILQEHAWPGNIRELRNVVYETLVYKRAGTQVLPSDLPRRLLAPEPPSEVAPAGIVDRAGIAALIAARRFDLRDAVSQLERAAVEEALHATAGNVARAARLLGRVGRGRATDPGGTLRAMLVRLGIKPPQGASAPR